MSIPAEFSCLREGSFLDLSISPRASSCGGSPQDTNLSGANVFISYKGESLRKAIGLKLYRVINDDIKGALTDFVVSQVTVNDGYSDTHTHYSYDAASASMAPAGAGALYGKVTTVYSGASAVVDKSNGFTESLFHGDESALYKGLLYQTTIFNHQGAPVATNKTHWKAFRKKLTSDGIGRARKGYFVRSVATIARIDGATTCNEMEYCTSAVQSFALDPDSPLPFPLPAFPVPFVISGCAEVKGADGWHIDANHRLAHSSRSVSSGRCRALALNNRPADRR